MKKAERQLLKARRLMSTKRYKRMGECNLCGDCCETEGPDGGPCEYFLRETPDRGICTVYGEEARYERCPLFPENPHHPFERCGYWFIDKHDGGRWIKPKGMIDDGNSSSSEPDDSR